MLDTVTGIHSRYFNASRWNASRKALAKANRPNVAIEPPVHLGPVFDASQRVVHVKLDKPADVWALDLAACTLKVLRMLARRRNVVGRSKLNKAGLVAALS